MGTREVAREKGAQKARRILNEIGREIRDARLERSLSQTAVAVAARTSRSQVSRIELAQAPRVSVVQLSRLLAVVGMELSARAYPTGTPIRDAAHLALIARFRALVPRTVGWRFEVPLEIPGDLRAWDAVMAIGQARVAVEAETRPHDLQALQRRIALKRRDSPDIGSVVLLLANTRHNRILLRQEGDVLRAEMPLPGAALLDALAVGHAPGGSGIVLI
jgi:transcriptional regulator with XRE-family HTH domain